MSYSDSDIADGADTADGTPSRKRDLMIATLIVWTLVFVTALGLFFVQRPLTTPCGGFSCGAGSSVSNAPG